MTVNSTTNRVSYTRNGTANPLAVSFPFQATTDLVVVETVIATGVDTVKTLTTDYTVGGTPDANGFYPNGGTVTPVATKSSSYRWTIYRDPALTQLTDIVDNDPLPAASIENPLDKLTMIAQRLKEVSSRTLRQSEGDTGTLGYLPAVETRKGMALVFDATTGDPTVGEPTYAGSFDDGFVMTSLPLTQTFYGSGLSAKMAMNISATCTSATVAEIGAQIHLASDLGLGNADAFKLAFTASVNGGASSASVYAQNNIATGRAGTGGHLISCLENNLQNQGAAATGVGTGTASYGSVTTAGGAFSNTAAHLVTTSVGSSFTYAHFVTGDVVVPFQASGTHTKGISFENSTTSLCAMALPNNLIAVMQQDSTATLRSLLKLDSSNNTQIGYGSPLVLNGAVSFGGHLTPHADNTDNIGSASYRVKEIFAANAVINTSGRATKDNIRELNDAEKRAARRLDGMRKIYQNRDSLAVKGKAARLHCGFIFEEVWDVLESEGLNPGVYGFMCADPVFKAEEVRTPKLRHKTTYDTSPASRVVMRDGVAVLEQFEEVTTKFEFGDPVPMYNEDGTPVMEKGPLLRDDEGNVLLGPDGKAKYGAARQKMYAPPVMEEYDEINYVDVPVMDETTGEQKKVVALRYGPLNDFIRAGVIGL